jgi:hypothetical protein
MRYILGSECCIHIALLWHSDYIDSSRVLDENMHIPANIISDECLSCTSSWRGNFCKGGFYDIVVGFIDISMPWDRDN